MSTTLTLNPMQMLPLQQAMAADVHAAVIEMHLRIIGEDGCDRYRSTLAAWRETLRSIANPWERRSFIGGVRFIFKGLRMQRGTEVRGRDYVAKVAKARGGQ